MKKKIEKLSEQELYEIMEDSSNYDRVRISAVKRLYVDSRFDNISDRCRVIFNPMYHLLMGDGGAEGIEVLFSIEEEDLDLQNDLAVHFKKIFVEELIVMYESGLINLKYHED